MKSVFRFGAAAAVIAATLVGCDWGGVSSSESWNDAYAWANFSGTYKLVNNIIPEAGENDSATSKPVEIQGMNKISSPTGQKLSPVGDGIASAKVSLKSKYTPTEPSAQNPGGLVDLAFVKVAEKDGTITLKPTTSQAEFPVCTIDKKTGVVSFALGANYTLIEAQVNYTYITSTPISAGSIESGTADALDPITWLNVTQKGNLLTLQDNDGRTYAGKITGASCPDADAAGYVTPGHIRFSFEATCTSNAKYKISGSLSGNWSGAQNETSGTISDRTIDGSFVNGGSPTQFQAVSGPVTVLAKTVTPTAGAY